MHTHTAHDKRTLPHFRDIAEKLIVSPPFRKIGLYQNINSAAKGKYGTQGENKANNLYPDNYAMSYTKLHWTHKVSRLPGQVTVNKYL